MTTVGRSLATNIKAALGGEAIQFPLSLLVFFGLVFSLSEIDFGLWAIMTSTAMIIGTVANLGAQELLVREVARGADFATQWGIMLTTQTAGAAVGIIVAIGARELFFPEVALSTALLIMMTNLLFFWAVEGCVRCGQAREQLQIGTRSRGAFAAARVAGVGVFALSGSESLATYALIAFPFALLGTVFALVQVSTVTGERPKYALPDVAYLRDGLPFVGMYGAQDMLAQFDRPLMNRYGLTADAGFYAIADRAVRLASLPSTAIARATSAEFFRTGGTNPAATFQLAKKFARPTAAYGVVAMVGMWIGIAVLGGVVPERFETVVDMLIYLAPIPLFQALQMFPANMLTSIDRQPLRMLIYFGAVVVNVLANIVLIPRYGWEGAAIATLAAEFTLVVALWSTASSLAKTPATSSPGATP